MMISLAAAMSGCISTPDTKALVTPIGGIGIHSFRPERNPNRMLPPGAERVAQLTAHQACETEASCVQHQ